MARVKIGHIVQKVSDNTAADATVTVRLRGTTDNAQLYNASDATIGNPTTTVGGRIEAFVDEGRYDLVVSGAGFTTYTQQFEAVAPTLTGDISSAKLADNAVTTPKILDTSITTAKIADGAITSPKLAVGVNISSGTQTTLSYAAGFGSDLTAPARYRKDGTNMVHLKGAIKPSGTTGTGTVTLATLPAGFRPASGGWLGVAGVSTGAVGSSVLVWVIAVNVAGDINLAIPDTTPLGAPGKIFLDLISFLAEN